MDVGDCVITCKSSLVIPLNEPVPDFHVLLVDVLSRGPLEDLPRDTDPLGDCPSGLRVVGWPVELSLSCTRRDVEVFQKSLANDNIMASKWEN